jgi:lactate dehydrogenase-like 2-hydroxyacid dehydrogenase
LTVDSNGYLQSLELAEKEAITTESEESYGIGSGIIGGGTIGRSARSRAKSKSVSAKVSIKRNISLTATARVRITT